MAGEELDPVGVGLAEAIRRVRTELEQATKEGAQSGVAFRARPVELEFEVAFTKTGGYKVGFSCRCYRWGPNGSVLRRPLIP